jgi:hypothetical protein
MKQYLLFWLAEHAIGLALWIAIFLVAYVVGWCSIQLQKRRDQTEILQRVKSVVALSAAEEKRVARHIWSELPLDRQWYSISFDARFMSAIKFARKLKIESV